MKGLTVKVLDRVKGFHVCLEAGGEGGGGGLKLDYNNKIKTTYGVCSTT